MSTKTKINTLPWTVETDSADRKVIKGINNAAKSVSIIVADSWVDPKHTAYIVKAVNNHEALVAALERAVDALGFCRMKLTNKEDSSLMFDVMTQARKALYEAGAL